jgi:SAM-dependent methyltransferase
MPVPEEIESRYYTSQGFDPEHSRVVRSHYLQFVEGRELLVELGCGRGEFLEVAKDKVARVVGVDVDPDMVKQVEAAGFEAVHSDVLEYLRTTDHRPDAVFLAHLIEHLAVDDAFAMLQQAAAVIPPGGVIIIVTPNPACLANLTNDFWSDPTHQRLYTLDLLAFLLDQTGFDVRAADGNPVDVPGPPPELLSPQPLSGWGPPDVEIAPRDLIEYTDQPHMDSVLDELRKLRQSVELLVNWQSVSNERMVELRHYAEHSAARHDDALRYHYGPNEIYVVGARRS